MSTTTYVISVYWKKSPLFTFFDCFDSIVDVLQLGPIGLQSIIPLLLSSHLSNSIFEKVVYMNMHYNVDGLKFFFAVFISEKTLNETFQSNFSGNLKSFSSFKFHRSQKYVHFLLLNVSSMH